MKISMDAPPAGTDVEREQPARCYAAATVDRPGRAAGDEHE
jgi:hypothetical protein